LRWTDYRSAIILKDRSLSKLGDGGRLVQLTKNRLGGLRQGSQLLLDRAGNLYGTTQIGGQSDYGVVFKLAPDGTETVLHDFSGGADGGSPNSGLIADKRGSLYGTAFGGGNCGGLRGTVFGISPEGTFKVLYAFQGGADGSNPKVNLARDETGNLYGVTASGGPTTRVQSSRLRHSLRSTTLFWMGSACLELREKFGRLLTIEVGFTQRTAVQRSVRDGRLSHDRSRVVISELRN
jgi:uncharacterized repeat protein (TIGR03803 family)